MTYPLNFPNASTPHAKSLRKSPPQKHANQMPLVISSTLVIVDEGGIIRQSIRRTVEAMVHFAA